MGKWKISKQFDFCYGHRVYTQTLDGDLSCGMKCKCRSPHGHQGTIIVQLKGDSLDERGMVIDFNELAWFKKWVDDVLDHKNILCYNDPMLPIFYPLIKDISTIELLSKYLVFENSVYLIKPEFYTSLSITEQEVYDGLVLVDFVPTSENLSAWLWKIVNDKIGHLCKVSSIQFFETPKSQSIYIGGKPKIKKNKRKQ